MIDFIIFSTFQITAGIVKVINTWQDFFSNRLYILSEIISELTYHFIVIYTVSFILGKTILFMINWYTAIIRNSNSFTAIEFSSFDVIHYIFFYEIMSHVVSNVFNIHRRIDFFPILISVISFENVFLNFQ